MSLHEGPCSAPEALVISSYSIMKLWWQLYKPCSTCVETKPKLQIRLLFTRQPPSDTNKSKRR